MAESDYVDANHPFAVAFKIRNSKGFVTRKYLRGFIMCNIRVEGECNFWNPPVGSKMNREQIIDTFVSDEYLAQHVGWTPNAIGQECELSPLWEANGAICNRNKTRQAEYERRQQGVVTINPKTEVGKKLLAEAAAREQAVRDEELRKIEQAKVEARREKVRALTAAERKHWLNYDTSKMPVEYAGPINQWKADIIECLAFDKAQAAAK